MRVHLGWLTFLLGVAFVLCLFFILIWNAWFGFPNQRALLGFFAFGVPAMVITLATAALWDGHKALEKLLGWVATMAGIAAAIAVLALVIGWVISEQPNMPGMLVLSRLLGFGTAAVMSGAFGIQMLYKAEDKTAPRF